MDRVQKGDILFLPFANPLVIREKRLKENSFSKSFIYYPFPNLFSLIYQESDIWLTLCITNKFFKKKHK
jgi:hypothetical protein